MADVLMPARLTAENGAKAALIGEFHELIEVPGCGCDHEECCPYECDHPTTITESVPVSWDTIKAIYHRAVRELGRQPNHGRIFDGTGTQTQSERRRENR